MFKLNSKGISIRILNSILTAITASVFAAILIISFHIDKRFNSVESALDKFIVCQTSSKIVKESANYLTEQARLFVMTHNPVYAEAYLKEKNTDRGRETALENLQKVCTVDDLAYQRLQVAQSQAENLINIEVYALKLIYEAYKETIQEIPEEIKNLNLRTSDKGKSSDYLKKLAVDTLFGDGYLIYKKRVDVNCDLTIKNIEEEIKQELNMNYTILGYKLKHLRQALSLLFIATLVTFLTFEFLVLRTLSKFKNSMENDQRLDITGSSEFRYFADTYNKIYDIKARNEKELLFNAEYDALTGILNRRAFDQICERCQKENDKLALLLIDMDNFKYINDTFGHTGGDIALKTLAQHLKSTFRKNDYVCRIGGDEFAVVLRSLKASANDAIINKVRFINELLKDIEGGISPVSISVGAAISEAGYTPDLYQKADQALYFVKSNGRKGCKIYDE